jgi:hypothetical protein
MAKFIQSRQVQHPLHKVVTAIATGLHERGGALKNPDTAKMVISMESLDEVAFAEFGSRADSAVAALAGFYKVGTGKPSMEGFTESQIKAGAIALMAAGNPSGYQARAAACDFVPGQGANYTNIGFMSGGSDGLGGRLVATAPTISKEAFDDRELIANLPFSVVFNVQAARQSDFCESFYPTLTVTPDQGNIDVSVRRTMVFNDVKHELSGKPMDFHRRNLIEGIVDYKLLETNSTALVPVYIGDNLDANYNAEKFSTLVGSYVKHVDRVEVTTRPLKPGVDIGLIGISQHEGLIASGILNNTDTVDLKNNLDNVYIEIHSTSVVGAGATSVIPFNVYNLPRSQFQKAPEGLVQDLILNFGTVDLPITGASSDAANAPNATALAYLRTGGRENWVVRLKITVTGNLNVESGNLSVNPASVTIASVWDVDPVTNDYTEVTGADLTALHAEFDIIRLDSFEIASSRSNLNRRTRGIQVTTVEQNERYMIPLGAPINCPTPVTNTRTSTDMAAPITACRIQTDNKAITKLLRYADTLSAYKLSQSYLVPTPNIEGIGRYLIKPFYEFYELDLLQVTASLKSTDRAGDVSAAIVNKIREMSYRAYTATAYQPALDAATGNTGDKPKLLIGTDPVLSQHILVSGDTRTASIAFDHKIVSHIDLRLRNHIYMTFVRDGQAGPDPLSFGFMAWMPELATSLPMTREGALVNEVMVQPRFLHINTCPILMVIKVKNLDVAIAGKLPIYTDEV